MTRVGWLADVASYVGGAELTQAEFRAAAPDGVEIIDCPPGQIDDTCDVYAIHNCMTYCLPGSSDLEIVRHKPAVKYHNDVGTWIPEDTRKLLDRHAKPICCSPLQAEYMGFADAEIVPPQVDLARFEQAAAARNGDRQGAVCVGSWRNLGKAPHRVMEWAAGNGGVDFFGDGPLAPTSSKPVNYADMPDLLARYRTFVFLPTVIEPFGRTVVEAWAAGCALVVNEQLGARWWITENPDGLYTAAQDFWRVVLCAS